MAHGNWISFSSHQSPLETLRGTYQAAATSLIPFESCTDSYQQYLYNAMYGNGNGNDELNSNSNSKQQLLHYQIPNSQQPNVVDLSTLSSHFQSTQAPKLEDFFGAHHQSSYSQTETQDSSSLSNVYEQGSSSHFVDQQQDLKGITVSTGFQTFSTNSGSEVEDSVSATTTTGNLFSCGNFQSSNNNTSFESRNNELMFCDASQALSLGVGQNSDTRIVSVEPAETPKKPVSDTFGQRTSVYRGVTRHRWTGRYEAHLWDNSCRREGQSRKGRQVYLGGYDKEDKAARAYDLAALKYWGASATTNFPVANYSQEIEDMKNMTKQEFIASLRRKSSGFSRGASIYRGVTRHHQQGRWQARIGRVAGNKDLYLGTFGTEEEAAEAYDIAAIKFRGMNAVTNFEMNRYDVEAIANSSLPIGAAAKRLKLSLEAESPMPIAAHDFQQSSNSSTDIVALPNATYDASAAMYHQNLLQHYNSTTAVGSSDSTSSTSVSMALMPQPDYNSRNFLYGFSTPLNMDNQFSRHDSSANYHWSMGSSSN